MAAWDDENEDDGVARAFVYGSGPQDRPDSGDAYQGARGAAPSTTPSLPSPTPQPSTRSQPAPNEDADLQPPVYRPTPLPTPPASHEDEYKSLEQQLSQYGKPIDRNAPGMKPSIGQEIRGRVAAALTGFAGSPNAVSLGRSVINQNYDRAEQARQQNLANTQQQLGMLRDQSQMEGQDWEHSLQAHNAGVADYNAQELAYQGQINARDRQAQEQQRLQAVAPRTEQPDDPKNPMGSWHATTVGGKAIKLSGPPDSWLKTPQGKAASQEADRSAMIDDLRSRGQKLTPEDEKYIMVNGKLREPNPTTTIRNEPEGKAEFDAYIRSLGHPPTTQDILNYKHGGKGSAASGLSKSLSDRIESQKQTAINKARQQFGKGDDPNYTLDDYLNDWQQAQDDYEERIRNATHEDVPHLDVRSHVDQKGNWVSGGKGGRQQTSAAAPEQKTAAQPQPAQGGGGQVTIQLPDGRVGTIPASNLAAALKRGAKQVQ